MGTSSVSCAVTCGRGMTCGIYLLCPEDWADSGVDVEPGNWDGYTAGAKWRGRLLDAFRPSAVSCQYETSGSRRMDSHRTYRRLFVLLAVAGLTLDLGSKYGMFHWMYTPGALRTDKDVIPGWFKFTAEYDPSREPSEFAWVKSLQTLSAPEMPRVNHGALFGLGNNQKADANRVFTGISIAAALGILIWA